MCAPCRRVSPALRAVAALRAGACLIGQPHRRVVHLATGALTPAGRPSRPPLCGLRAVGLQVVPVPPAVALRHRRMCRTCRHLTPASLGVTDHAPVTTAAGWAAAYSHLTAGDVTLAGRWSRTVDDTWQASRCAQLLGPRPLAGRSRLTAAQCDLLEAWDTAVDRRRVLEPAERTAAQQQYLDRTAAKEAADREAAERAGRALTREVATARARADRLAGRYVLPSRRDLLDEPTPT